MTMATRVGKLEVFYSSRGIPTYSVELWHDGLKKHRLIKGSDNAIVRRKADLQAAEWEEKWTQVSARDQDRRDKEGQKRQQEANKRLAAERTAEAQRELDRLRSVLRHTLEVNDAINWDDLKDRSEFPERPPAKPQLPKKAQPRSLPPEPSIHAPAYQPKLGFLGKVMASRRERLVSECRERFNTDHAQWIREVKAITVANASAEAEYRKRLDEAEQKYQNELKAWEDRRASFLEQQSLSNEAIDKKHKDYMACSPEAVLEYCDLMLSLSDYPDYFAQEFNLDYNPDTKLLLVDYALPAPDDIPMIDELKYVANRDEFIEHQMSQAQLSKLYDDLLYQIVLRTIHELFEADVVEALESIVFNGFVTSVDRSSGQQVTACVMSLQAKREEFMAINLANVDPKACFKALKGVGSSKLHSLAAVPPIMRMDRNDSRFVAAYEVADTLDDSFSLATMDWEDFEHLIRELFEKEFSSGGGEVKVTQASRDGGVDAVAFDPDPIRGGKIVIQAKRYANTVGVGAVRDLYGTVMNEGANKGILVTTSDYGPDAYAFANGKPLVLLNGANLLHMLEKHGHKARIDLNEARQMAKGHSGR
jgi:restriction system protein